MKQSTLGRPYMAVLFALSLSAALSACHSAEKTTGTLALYAYFDEAALPDTLRFEFRDGDDQPTGDTIPNALFFTALDTAWLHEIDYVADSSMATVFAQGRFPLSADVDACLVDIREAWFKHQSLLLFDKKKKTFTGRLTVAEWYGGESGQILTGSWLVDYDGDQKKDLVLRQIDHWIKPSGEEFVESTKELASLRHWDGSQFVEVPVADSAALIRQFPIHSYW